MKSVHVSIKSLISKMRPGNLLYPSDFRGIGTDSAIKKTLSRMAQSGEISRLAHGMYYIPRVDPVLGSTRPTIDEVILMLAEKEKIKIKPAGAFALHQLGLTNQVPTKRVYITDGSQRLLVIGNQKISLKKTTPKKLSRKGKISSLIIQALEELGTEHIDHETNRRLKELLKKENSKILHNDLKLANTRINNYIVNLMKEIHL